MTARRSPLAGLTFSLVGPGKVGSTLACWAVARGAEAIAVVGRPGSDRVRDLAGRLDGAPVPLDRLATEGQDLLLVSVPDAVLATVVTALAERPQAAVVLHSSGSRDASALAALRQHGSAVGSFHPVRRFADSTADADGSAGTLFVADGDPAALVTARRLADAWQATLSEMPGEARALFHLAEELASDGILTLLAAVAELVRRAGLPPEVLAGLLHLARGTAAEAAQVPEPAAALCGAVAAGDREALSSDLAALARTAPELIPTFVAVAGETLRQLSRSALAGPEPTGLAEVLATFSHQGAFLDPP